MKRIFLINLMAVVLAGSLQAQNKEARKKIESARIALITERLGLEPEQAERFWPIYREFTSKRQELKKQFNEARAGVDLDNANEEQRKNLLELRLKLKEQEVGLERQYSDRLLNVISTKQILSLRQAEEDFRTIILERIQRQRQQQRIRQQRRQRNEQLQNRRNN